MECLRFCWEVCGHDVGETKVDCLALFIPERLYFTSIDQ